MSEHILNLLYEVLQTRKGAAAESSYVASLYAKGARKIADKISEEAQETIVESLALEKNAGDEKIRVALKSETADLLFHMMVMLSHHDIKPDEVFAVLEKRFGTSGHAEKAARAK